jgi:hypothetical protein
VAILRGTPKTWRDRAIHFLAQSQGANYPACGTIGICALVRRFFIGEAI